MSSGTRRPTDASAFSAPIAIRLLAITSAVMSSCSRQQLQRRRAPALDPVAPVGDQRLEVMHVHRGLVAAAARPAGLDAGGAGDQPDSLVAGGHQVLDGEAGPALAVGHHRVGARVVHVTVERHDGDPEVQQLPDLRAAGIGGERITPDTRSPASISR